VVGRVAATRLLIAVTGAAEREVLDGLDAACAGRLLVEQGDEAYQFAHDLIREVMLADLSAARRRALHRRIAQALEQAPGEPPLALLAYHYARSAATEKALTYLERAGDQARQRHANAEAAGYYRELIGRLEALGRAGETARAREKLGEVLKTQGQYDPALAVLKQALSAYQAAQDLEGTARVTAVMAATYTDRGSTKIGLALLEHLLAAPETSRISPASLARLYAQLAECLWFAQRPRSEMLATAVHAADLAREAGEAQALATAERERGRALVELGRREEASQVLRDALHLAEAAGDLRSVCLVWNKLGLAHRDWGEPEVALDCFGRALEAAERLGDPTLMSAVTFNLHSLAFNQGRWADARSKIEHLRSTLRDLGATWVAALPVQVLGELALAEGRREAAVALLEEGVELAERSGNAWYAQKNCAFTLAEADLLAGQPGRAIERLEPLYLRAQETSAPMDNNHLVVLAWAFTDLGRETEAEALVESVLAAERVRANRAELIAPQVVKARLATRRGRWAEAEEALEEALGYCRVMAFRYPEAKVLHAYGLLDSARSEPERAREHFAAALAILGPLGERLYAEQAERALDRLASEDPKPPS
jgi:tetratricopeptide (TPR) repeat protein